MSNQVYAYNRKGVFIKALGRIAGKNFRRAVIWPLAAFSMAVILSACAADITKHGHVFTDEDLAQVKEGMSRDQVILALGTPDTKSTVDQKAYYYISSTTKRSAAFLSPSIVDRRVVAVYFSDKDIVQRVAHYGLKDGRVVDFISRTTPSHGSEDGLLKELFRNIGHPPTPGGPNAN
jgi:outer membrane protein assembly factor BamE (lipoprotein component of BamABCDE complex)